MESLLENWEYRKLSHEELIKQYQETLDLVKEQRKEIKDEINQLKDIFKKNKLSGRSTRLTKKRKAEIKERWQQLEAEDAPYSLIQGNLEHSLSWMKYGHAPGVIRGIERRAVYEREKPCDPLLMQRYFRSSQSRFAWDSDIKQSVITPTERIVLDRAMATLTEKELEVYLMYKGKGFSQYKIGELLGISRNAVKSRIAKAEKKIACILQEMEDVI